MEHLHLDHIHTARLLDILEEELEVLHDGGSPDYQLMIDIMHYMTQYPDMFHHPREDVVFERMLLRDATLTRVLSELLQDHELLAQKGTKFHAILTGVLEGVVVARGEVERLGREYVHSLREHMDVEEGEVFPIATALLDEQDWQAVDDAVERRQDPLFGSDVEERYGTLYEYIQTSAN